MLDKLIHFSINNKLIVAIMSLALAIWGVYSLTQLPIDAVPDITNNQVQVMTVSPSLSAQEVERLITFPVEQAMATINQITEIRSISRFGLSVVTIVFNDNVDIYWARQQVGERLVNVQSTIPQAIGKPELGPITSGLGEIYQYIIKPKAGYEKKYDAMELRNLQDWLVRRQLLGTPGVADVSSFGGFLKQYEIALNPDKLRSYNLGIQDVFKALEMNNQNTGGAYIDKKPSAYFIRSEGLIKSLEDIDKIQVTTTTEGLPILIRDLAKVQYGHANRYGAMTSDGKGEVVGAIVLMLKGENSSKVIDQVKTRIALIEKMLPEGVVIEPYLDRSKLVDKAIHTVAKNLIEGTLIVIFVLMLFLGNIRGGLVVASVIPLAMLFAVSMMNLFGVSGNLMSLGAIDFGLIVDGAVIIVEATLHHLGMSKLTKLNQKQMDDEVYESAVKIRSSAAFGEIIILIVYLPILALSGVEGKMFRPMAQTVGFAILGAFILSLTYVPMMSALFLSKNINHKEGFSEKMMNRFQKIYAPALNFVLNKKRWIVGSTLALFVASIVLFMNMGGEFIPSLDEGDFAVETRVLVGSSLTHTIDVSTKAEKILLDKFPEVKKVVSKIGSSEIPIDPMPVEACDLIIVLKDKDEWTSATTTEELVEKMTHELEALPGVSFGFQQPIQMRFNELMTGARQDVAVKIFGEDLEQLTVLAKKVAKVIAHTKGAEDLYVEQVSGLPQVVIKIDREKLYQFNVSVEDVNKCINASFAGMSAGVVYEGEKRFDLVVRLEKESRNNVQDVKNLYVNNTHGEAIPLEQLAEVTLQPGPNQIQREDTRRRLTLGFNVRGRDVESIVNEIQQNIDANVIMPSGYYVTYGGQFENLLEAKKRLSIAVPVALLLIFVLLYFTFHSFKQSLLIFTAIPLSAIGGVWALWLRGMPFSISAGIGFIALFGVAVLNGIVLIAEFNRLKAEGHTDLLDIIRIGTSHRLRPVLMTATVASLGFFPMAFSNGSGAEVQKPLATVVMGGLLSATFLTLLVLPILYIWFEKGFKKSLPNPSNTLLILLCCTFAFYSAKAQPYNLEKSIEVAMANNQNVTKAEYQVAFSKQMKATAFDLAKTNITGMYGQYNTYRNDLNVTVTQHFAFPTAYVRMADLAKANIESSQLRKSVFENELTYQIKYTWYGLQYLMGYEAILLKQDSIFTKFVKAANSRYAAGESNYLEKITAETQQYELRNRLAQNKADRLIMETRLKTLMGVTDGSVSFLTAVQQRRDLQLGNDTLAYASNPALAYFKQQVAVAQKQKSVEQSNFLPDFSLGYFNQSLKGNQEKDNGGIQYYNAKDRFQGVMLGLSLPLWTRAFSAKVKAAGFQQKITEAEYAYQQQSMQGQYKELLLEFQKQKQSLAFYEANVLPMADLILANASKGYQAGEIGYFEYVTALNKYLSIKTEYENSLSMYNKSVVNIEFVIGKN